MKSKRTFRNETGGAPGNPWMLTFADLLSLMLTFFVLVFSMNTVQYDGWKAVVTTMNKEFNPGRAQISITPHETPSTLLTSKSKGLNLSYLQAVLTRGLGQIPEFETGEVLRVRDTIVISLPASVLFERKTAQTKTDGVRALQQLSGMLIQLRNRVQVAGHTDPSPITNKLFRTNWELSLTRARIIAGIVADAGYRQPMTVVGYADTRFKDLHGSLTRKQRYDLAERIDIIIIDERRDRGLYDLL